MPGSPLNSILDLLLKYLCCMSKPCDDAQTNIDRENVLVGNDANYYHNIPNFGKSKIVQQITNNMLKKDNQINIIENFI